MRKNQWCLIRIEHVFVASSRVDRDRHRERERYRFLFIKTPYTCQAFGHTYQNWIFSLDTISHHWDSMPSSRLPMIRIQIDRARHRSRFSSFVHIFLCWICASVPDDTLAGIAPYDCLAKFTDTKEEEQKNMIDWFAENWIWFNKFSPENRSWWNPCHCCTETGPFWRLWLAQLKSSLEFNQNKSTKITLVKNRATNASIIIIIQLCKWSSWH